MEPIKHSEINTLVKEIDIFITSVSFEERCFTAIQSLKKDSFKEHWICYNKNEVDFFSNNLEKLKSYSNNYSMIEFDLDAPIITANSLLKKFKSLNTKADNLLVDITTFTHEGLLILFKYIIMYKSNFNNIYLLYTGASDYDVNEKNDDKKWLTKGIKSIRSVLGYPGVLNPSKKNHLIILFGFESERTQKLIENFEFDKVSLGFGAERDSIKNTHHQINIKRHLALLDAFPTAEKFEFSLRDPYIAKGQILKQVSKYPDYNVVIAPLNNKLSTIGSALASNEKPEIQLCYIRAHEYNLNGYSSASDQCYIVKLV
jgi:hypothetical protein